MKIKYGISIVSALRVGVRRSLRPPGCFFASVEKIVRELVALGYDGVQMIPVWDLDVQKVLNRTLLSQGPWNAVPGPLPALRHEIGTLGVPSQLQDWIVSPPPAECQRLVDEMNRAGIRRIHHDLGEGELVELHPGLDKTVPKIIELCQAGSLRLVLDLRHLRRSYGDFELEEEGKREFRQSLYPSPLWSEPTMTEWQSVIDRLAPWIDVIHVQPGDNETPEEFATNPLETETGQLLRYALQRIETLDPGRELVLIAEYHPGVRRILNPRASRRLAGDYLTAMKLIAKEAER
jgi:hypothetical protein